MTTDADAERMARAGRRLRDALQPREDLEEFCLEVLGQRERQTTRRRRSGHQRWRPGQRPFCRSPRTGPRTQSCER
jgi:hypothetical protein